MRPGKPPGIFLSDPQHWLWAVADIGPTEPCYAVSISDSILITTEA